VLIPTTSKLSHLECEIKGPGPQGRWSNTFTESLSAPYETRGEHNVAKRLMKGSRLNPGCQDGSWQQQPAIRQDLRLKGEPLALLCSHSRDAGDANYRCCSPRCCQAAAFLRVFGHLLLLLTDICPAEQHGGGLASLGWLLSARGACLPVCGAALRRHFGVLASPSRGWLSQAWRDQPFGESISCRHR
jgi:hypothetical protein